MRMRARSAIARLGAVLLLATLGAPLSARAHIVPIPPSTCVFDPVDLQVPAMQLSGAAQPGGTADTMRIVYDSSASKIQLCAAPGGADVCGDAVPRPFTVGATAGTLTLPGIFNGRMLSSGDVTITDLPVSIAIGGVTATVPVTLTTALVALEGRVFEGVPLQGLGSLVLVGALNAAALPPPFAGQSVLLTLSCLPRPVPDKDQFALPLRTTSIAGRLGSRQARIRATSDGSFVMPSDFTTGPLLLAVDVGGATVASAVVSGGLRGRRKVVGKSDDGRATIAVRSERRRGTSRLVLTAEFRGVTVPPEPAGAPVLLDLTFSVGGVIGRGEQLFHVDRTGHRLRGG